jgi:hypothetical protein
MRKNILLLLVALTGTTFAADWPDIEGMNFTHRVAVTLENPADVNDESALVHLSLAELKKVFPDASIQRQIAVIDSAAPPAKRERADENFVQFQIDEGQLIFAMPLAPHEKKQLYIYESKTDLNLPGFPAQTAWDNRHAYRSFENIFMAFRCETGPGANTTGFAIDMFGKSKAGRGLRLVEIYEQNDYHHPQTWGVDILKVGSSPGLGGAYVYAGEKSGRPNPTDTYLDCVYQGPVETLLRGVAYFEVAGRKIQLRRELSVVANDRSVHDHIAVVADKLDDLQIGIGLRNLPDEKWAEDPKSGYAMVTGKNNQPGCKSIGLSAVFDPSAYVKTIDLADEKDGGHVYVVKGHVEAGAFLVSDHRFTGIWDGDGDVNNPKDLEKTLQRWAKLREMPVKVEVGKKLEAKP